MLTNKPDLYVWLLHGDGFNDAYTFVGPFADADVAGQWGEQHQHHVLDWQLVRCDPQQPRILSPEDANKIYDGNGVNEAAD